MSTEETLKIKSEDFQKSIKELEEKSGLVLMALPQLVPQSNGTFSIAAGLHLAPKPSPIATPTKKEAPKIELKK